MHSVVLFFGGFVILKMKVSCQDRALAKSFSMTNKLKPRIRPVDYHLEGCIEVRF